MIDGVRFGGMTVGGVEHGKDLIVFAPGVVSGEETCVGPWWREQGHSLSPADLSAVADASPEALVIGPGAYGRMKVPEGTLAWLRDRGIEPVVCPDTGEAARRYNELAEAGRRVAGAFHLTC